MTLVNQKGCEILGYQEKDLLGQNWFELCLPKIVYQEMWETFNRITAGETDLAEYYENLVLTRSGERRIIAFHNAVLRGPSGEIRGVISSGEDITERKLIEDTLFFLTQHRQLTEGQNFFNGLAHFLAEKLEMDYVCIDRLQGDGLAAQTVAIYFDGRFEDNVSYTLKDTPCGDVVGKTICCFPDQVCQLFPKDTVLQEMSAESYVGTTLWSSRGQAIGLIALISRTPLTNSHLVEAVLRLVADPAAEEFEREQSVAALKKWAQVFEHGEWGVSVSLDLKHFEMVNPAYARMHGYPIDELVGKPIEMVYPPEELPDFYKQNQGSDGKAHFTYETIHLRKDGSTFPAQVDITNVKDDTGEALYSITSVQDISERKRVESEIRHLSSFPRLNPIPILEVMHDGKLNYANQAALDVLSRTGIASASAFFPPDIDDLLTNKGKADKTQQNREVQIGDTIFEEILHFEPEFGNLRIYAIDITKRKQAEAALLEEHGELASRVEERTVELTRANVELARTARLKDAFLASMSHELRTPLTSILGLAEALQLKIYGDLTDKEMTSIHNIEESGRHLLSLINDILDLSKIDAGKVVLDIKPVSIFDVCRSSLQMIKQASQKKKIKVELKIDDSIETFPADERRLKQILVNLLTNAVKFTPEAGAIGLEVLGDTVNNRVKFIIWDTGIGIDPQDLEHLFKPFVQLDASLARKYEGTGLGLSLVLKLVDLFGGGVSVQSEPDQGSRFTVVLPLLNMEKAVDSMQLPALVSPVEVPRPSSQSLILLVDDNELYLIILSDLLVSKNYRVIVGHNGEEGIRLTREKMPDVILMDVQMPVLNGIQAAQRIRAEEHIKKIPIIALTALAMNGDREKCFQAGMNDYISKPVSIDDLQKVIEEQLRSKLSGLF